MTDSRELILKQCDRLVDSASTLVGVLPQWEVLSHKSVKREYNSLIASVESELGHHVRFSTFYSYQTLAAIEHLFRSDWDPATRSDFAKSFLRDVTLWMLDTAAASQHFALVPLDSRFNTLDKITTLGSFWILNPTRFKMEERPSAFIQMLESSVGPFLARDMQFGQPDKSELQRLSSELVHADGKVGGRLLDRPVLCCPVSAGMKEDVTWDLIYAQSQIAASVLRLISVRLDMMTRRRTNVTSLIEGVADAQIELLPVILFSAAATNSVESMGGFSECIEGKDVRFVDPKELSEEWDRTGINLYRLLTSAGSDEFRTSVRQAVATVGRCLYPGLGDLSLGCAIGLEAILIPFEGGSELAERIALFGSGILATSKASRVELYSRFKDIYKRRSRKVHGALLVPPQRLTESEEVMDSDMDLFYGCLRFLAEWAVNMQSEGREIDRKSFHEVYLDVLAKGWTGGPDRPA